MNTTPNIFQVVSETHLDEILDKYSQNIVVIMFSSKSCPPCMMVKPKFINLSKTNPDCFFVYVDLSSFDQPTHKYDSEIKCTPTFVYYFNKYQVASVTGPYETQIVKVIQNLRNQIDKKKKEAHERYLQLQRPPASQPESDIHMQRHQAAQPESEIHMQRPPAFQPESDIHMQRHQAAQPESDIHMQRHQAAQPESEIHVQQPNMGRLTGMQRSATFQPGSQNDTHMQIHQVSQPESGIHMPICNDPNGCAIPKIHQQNDTQMPICDDSNGCLIPQKNHSHDESNQLYKLKASMLKKLFHLTKNGVQLTTNYNMESDYDDMVWEYNLHTNPKGITVPSVYADNEVNEEQRILQPESNSLHLSQGSHTPQTPDLITLPGTNNGILTSTIEQMNKTQTDLLKKQDQIRKIQEIQKLNQLMMYQLARKANDIRDLERIKREKEREEKRSNRYEEDKYQDGFRERYNDRNDNKFNDRYSNDRYRDNTR